ncbi:MAG: glycosyltransferase family 1 protein [Gemmataceae bacterium]
MRVLVNGMAAVGRRTGIGHYTGELVRGLRDLLGADAVHCFEDALVARAKVWGQRWRRRQERRPAPPAAGPTQPGLKARLADAVRQAGQAWCAWGFRGRSRRGRFDLYHEPNFLPFASELPTVVTVHDLSVLLHPEWHPADRVRHHQREFLRGLQGCVHVITDTESVRAEVIRTLGFPADRVTRVPIGIRTGLRRLPEAEVAAQLRALDLPERYLLYLGTIEPRKNVRMLLEVYCTLPATVRARYPLLVVGGWGWNSGDVAAYLDDEARHRGVRYLGYVPEAALPALYNGARALLFPSHYEGFGLPPLEMLACGGAVLASTAASVAETVGRQAHLVPATDVDGWREALLRVCQDDDWHAELRQDAEHAARPFTWERCAVETAAVYERVLAGPVATRPARAA